MFKPTAIPFIAGLVLMMGTGVAAASTSTVTFSKDINPPSTKSFDISWVENSTGIDFVADRTNNAVDMIDAPSDTFLGYIAQGQFTGTGPRPCTAPGNSHACGGPNGVLTDSSHDVWAGDGNSTVKVLKPQPNTGAAAVLATIATGGTFRADEMAYDPRDQIVLVANDAEGFLTFIHAAGASSSVETHFYYADNTVGQPATKAGFSTPGGGIEQPVWDPGTGLFYQALPANSPSTQGRIDVFTASGSYVKSYTINGCTNGPTGLALGSNGAFLGACDNGAAVVEVHSGVTRSIVSGVGGADEIWFNPGDHNFYLAISGGPNLGVVNGDNYHVVTVASGHGGHSVAAYAGNNQVFDPEKSGGGVAVYVSSN
ncbi:MAG TPA: hypothetical protein VF157_00015 [Chloroflexota bacterium]